MNSIVKKVVSSIVLISLLCYTMPIFAVTNEETIYSKLKANGDNYKTIVSTNEDGEVNQEESDEDLPITYTVKYELDGKEISSEELAGKSGKVKITINYENKSENKVTVNGTQETMYTPFLVVSGTIINNKNNSNIEVTNGKVIENGDKTIVVGLCLPGMQESLKLNDVEIPESIEITMDTTNFEMNNIINFCTPKVLDEDIDWSMFDDIFDQVNTLSSSMDQIEDGSVSLNDGIIVLKDGVESLNSGASELTDGVKTLSTGANTLNDGAKSLKTGTEEYSSKSKEFNSAMKQLIAGVSKLNTGYTDLDNGIKSLNENAKKLEAGSKSVYDGLTQAKAGIETIDTSVEKIQAGATSLSEGATNLKQGTTSAKAGITQIINSVSALPGSDTTEEIEGLKELEDGNKTLIKSYEDINTALQAQINNVSDETLKATLTKQIELNEKNITALESNNTAINSTIDTLEASSTEAAQKLKNALDGLKEGIEGLETGATDLETGAKALEEGTKSLKAGTSNLNLSSDALVDGAKQVSDGMSKVSSGTEDLENGSATVKEGLTNLDDSSKQILSANNQLTDAAGTIASGAESLANGSSTLNDGVKTLLAGSNKLSEGTNTLLSGSVTLSEGSQTLTDGIHKFNAEGIQKISKYVNVDLQNLITRGQKLEELSNNYNTFGSDKERNSIKFISIIDSIKNSSQEKTNETAIVNSGDGDEDKD
jgi:putative membrane protein